MSKLHGKIVTLVGSLLCCLFCTLLTVQPAQAAPPPQVRANAAVLIDAESGAVLYGKNQFELLPPASTTKVLMALTALDIGDLDKTCVVSPAADAIGEASIYLSQGETLPLRDLLAAALIESANDACYTIGENLAGSEQLFVQMMNVKARTIAAGNVQARNTNGLPCDEHLLTAYALAQTSRLALQNPVFANLVQTQNLTLDSGAYSRKLKNTNKLLAQNNSVIGVKTGTTVAAGACLISALEQQDRRVIAVVLHSPDRYGESLRLLQYGCENFVNLRFAERGEALGEVPVSYGKQTRVKAVVAGDGVATVAKGQTETLHREVQLFTELTAPIRAGQIVGYVTLQSAQHEKIAQLPLLAEQNIEKKKGLALLLEKLTNTK